MFLIVVYGEILILSDLKKKKVRFNKSGKAQFLYRDYCFYFLYKNNDEKMILYDLKGRNVFFIFFFLSLMYNFYNNGQKTLSEWILFIKIWSIINIILIFFFVLRRIFRKYWKIFGSHNGIVKKLIHFYSSCINLFSYKNIQKHAKGLNLNFASLFYHPRR